MKTRLRRDPQFPKILADQKVDFKVTPTNLAPSMTLEVEDYGLKASINDLHKAGFMNPTHSAFLSFARLPHHDRYPRPRAPDS
jgi:hypothetical protein